MKALLSFCLGVKQRWLHIIFGWVAVTRIFIFFCKMWYQQLIKIAPVACSFFNIFLSLSTFADCIFCVDLRRWGPLDWNQTLCITVFFVFPGKGQASRIRLNCIKMWGRKKQTSRTNAAFATSFFGVAAITHENMIHFCNIQYAKAKPPTKYFSGGGIFFSFYVPLKNTTSYRLNITVCSDSRWIDTQFRRVSSGSKSHICEIKWRVFVAQL